MRAGLVEVWRSPRLRPVALGVFANGLFMLGPFFVACPLLLRDQYEGGVEELGMLIMMFPIGTIVGSIGLLLRGGLRRKGRAQLLGLALAGGCVVAIGTTPPYPALLAIVAVWGFSAAVFLNSSRTLFQENARADLRGRVMAIYTLGILGMAPFSHLATGFLTERVGPAISCFIFGGCLLAIIAIMWVATPLRRFE